MKSKLKDEVRERSNDKRNEPKISISKTKQGERTDAVCSNEKKNNDRKMK